MNIKRLCTLLLLFLVASVAGSVLHAEVTSPPDRSREAAVVESTEGGTSTESVQEPAPSESLEKLVPVVESAEEGVSTESAGEDAAAAEPTSNESVQEPAPTESVDEDAPTEGLTSTETSERSTPPESSVLGSEDSRGTGPPHSPTAELREMGRELEEILSSLEKILPESWEVTGIRRRQVPRKWTGSPDGMFIRLENTSVVVYHPQGFEYHPFYKIWLCPPRWEGSMEEIEFLGNDGPSVLLGQNHHMKVFYLTLGANTWPEGPEKLREVLDLTALPITDTLRQRIDPSMNMKLSPSLAASSNGVSGLLSRIVGMERDGPLVYVEYATATERKINGHTLPSRCREPRVARLMERENLFLANKIFLAYPEVETIYLRRVCDEFLSDRIVNRSDETSGSPVSVSNSSH